MLEDVEMTENQQLSKEDYLIRRANEALSTDIYAAKSWLITAKSLFPDSAKVQFEAYRVEKLSKNVKEAAKCFSEMFQNFPEDREIWKEIERITSSLRSEQCDEETELLSYMFQHMPQDLQHRLLIMTADHSEDTMEHCKLLLLLLKRFPETIASHGPRLVETLLTAEKHSHPGKAVNEYRQLLACEALPLLGSAPVELNIKLSLKLLCKSLEFYFAYIRQPQDIQIPAPWEKMFQVIELIGKKLGWEFSNFFVTPWNWDIYYNKFLEHVTMDPCRFNDKLLVQQLIICSVVILTRILHEHTGLIANYEGAYCLVEAFVQTPERREERKDPAGIVFTSDGEYSGYGLEIAVKLYGIITSNTLLQRETNKIIEQMQLQSWLDSLFNDRLIYNKMYHDVLLRVPQEKDRWRDNIQKASACFFTQDYRSMVKFIYEVVNALPSVEGKISNVLTVSSDTATRHLHYLSLARFPVLQFCCRLLLAALKTIYLLPGRTPDVLLGHGMVLVQFDWPQEAQTLDQILRSIVYGSFTYPLFQDYIINVDILEEVSFLSTSKGGNVHLDLTANSGILKNRRITTRGKDKGAREEIRQIMRRQLARDGVDSLDELLKSFILNNQKSLKEFLTVR